MTKITQTRRGFLQTAAIAGAAGLTGTFPGISWSAEGDTLTVRFDREMESLDPGFYVGGHPPNDVNWCIMPALVHFGMVDGQASWVPSPYVESVEVVDSTHIDFTLKQGLMWSNGFGEVTAEDVAYSYDRMTESEWKGDYVAYERTEVKDKYSGTIILNQPFAPFMNLTLASGTGIILCKKATEEAGGKYTIEPPATCGPYVMEHKQAQYVRLRPNPDWTGPLPAFANIDCIFVTDSEAGALAFEAGELDCAKITSTSYARYLKETPPGAALTVAGALQYMWMGINIENPKLSDIRVRKAIQRAVDIDSIVQGAYSGTAEPSYGIICPGLVGKRDAAGYSYDPAEGKALMDEAGVSGLNLTLRTLNSPERLLAAQIIQVNLAQIGVTVEIIPLDSGPFWEMGQESKGDTYKDMELWIMRFGAGPDPYEATQWFIRDQVGVWNWERWSSDEFEELYKQGIGETDQAKRHEVYVRMQEIMEETGGYVWLTHEPEVFIHRDDIDAKFAPSGEMQMAYFAPK
ncbi:ABC transporter substrate-binding protein [Pseudohalocynthiibacter aestuariivivens]|jgi:peptide/nickel transport system substrate-binding protein|uniref:ABC transporter substrate-binding protein n=1 Tax=Pseudohalocynthiibacter aestuariivivens TaxID=1591409 RepID=A0ABV5JIS1_9RHOB|nr:MULTISPECIES: ABC transporter substrate-binding protein [Pseudohalocynthiibacter]MBS9718997.1 twin-arginine translocation signal domain-containing protein [Pseudohalocynthiibacter aestuariivivens]MCK0104574.1 ABC transporter substrate-binding protein [Pseudohalocynthiibacter sp. F2068]